jgi:2-methylcitrate dehydratase PrpD
VFHTTGTAGTLGAAAAAAHLHGVDGVTMNHALGSAGTMAAGVWEFLRDAADSKQLHTAAAAGKGVTAAFLAADGFTGATKILEGEQGLGAGMSRAPELAALTDDLGRRWAVTETSMKYHACCRHTHPAIDALLEIRRGARLQASDIDHIEARVYRAAFDVVGHISRPTTVHQSKFSLPFVLALAAIRGSASIDDFSDRTLNDETVLALARRVEVLVDPTIDSAYPSRWGSVVRIDCHDGRTLSAAVNSPKGDPDNQLSRAELEDKVTRLARYANAADDAETRDLIGAASALERRPTIGSLLPAA